MEKLYSFLENFISIPTVSGFESRGIEKAAAACIGFTGTFFDGYKILPSGSILFEKKCGKPGAKKLVFDAHADTIGFAVKEICENGFLKVVNLGGIDPYILPSCGVTIHGKEDIYGVFTSVPPHLADKNSKEELKLSDLYIDTGLPYETACEIISVGDTVTFAEKPILLKNGIVASPSLDDKACCAAALLACNTLAENKKELECDLYIHFSAGEEKTQLGAKTLPYIADADMCIVLDVNFAYGEGVERYESLIQGQGAGVSYSSSTRRHLTDFIVKTAENNNIPIQKVVEMKSTGTNASLMQRNGIPCAVLSVPLKNMHTYSECVSLYDITACAKLLAVIAENFHKFHETGVEVLK